MTFKQLLRTLTLTLMIMPPIGIMTSAQARELTNEQKLADLIQLRDMIKSHYAPLELKRTKYQLSIDNLFSEYEQKILATKTNAQFYYKLVEFVGEFKDGHFSIRVPTNHKALMPFSVEYVNGKVLIDEIVRDILPVEKFPFEKGDEVVGIDQFTIDDYINQNAVYQNQGNLVAKRALTAATLTRRMGALMPTPGKKSVVFILKDGESNAWGGKVPWIHLGDPLDEFDVTALMSAMAPEDFVTTKANATNLKALERTKSIRFFDNVEKTKKKMNFIPDLSLSDDLAPLLGNYHCSGETRIKIPVDATVIMEDPFVAYFHPTPAGNVGYLRIPHYSFDDNDLAFMQYEYAISELEANTVGLIIDQDHNCGGSIDFLHKMLSLFMDHSFTATPFSFLVNKVQVLQFRAMAKSLPDNTLFKKDFTKVKDLIYNAWLAKEKFTPLTPFFGNPNLYPNNIHYTKPIIVLIDYMSGSGGDAFPTMMQGLGRAKLLGTQTMGLGGHVERMPQLNNSGMMINMTRSLFFSPKGVAVENNGASPDIPYTVTKEDFMDEYQDYQKFYLEALMRELPSNTIPHNNLGVIPMDLAKE